VRLKKAVHRNRIKRLLREAWRLQKNGLAVQLEAAQKKLAVFIIYTNSELPQYPLLFEKTGLAIQRITEKMRP
jgi:ribonuclease P protein component